VGSPPLRCFRRRRGGSTIGGSPGRLPPAKGTELGPIVPALEQIWKGSMGQSMKDFNFRSVTDKFNALVYQYPPHPGVPAIPPSI